MGSLFREISSLTFGENLSGERMVSYFRIVHTYHNQAPYTTALVYAPSHLTERATHAHPLHPAALASVPYGIVLVRVRVRDEPSWTCGHGGPKRVTVSLCEREIWPVD